MRSSPEDAEHFRRHHDAALAALRSGISREELLRELVGCQVPEKTAERITVAVEQEKALTEASRQQKKPAGGLSWVLMFVTLSILAGDGGYIAWRRSRDIGLTVSNFLPMMVVGAGVAGIVIHRLLLKIKGPTDLP